MIKYVKCVGTNIGFSWWTKGAVYEVTPDGLVYAEDGDVYYYDTLINHGYSRANKFIPYIKEVKYVN